MSFEILEPTKARLDDIEVLSQKNRQPDEAPGVKLHLEVTVANHVLSTVDGRLKGWLYEKNEGSSPAPLATRRKDNQTGTLDGVEPVSDLPSLTRMGKMLKTITIHEEFTGYAAEIVFATTHIKLDDCSIPSGARFKLNDGGSVIIKFCLEAPNASEHVFAKLAKYKSREIEIVFAQHVPTQQQGTLDDTKDPKPAESIADHADKVVALVKAASDKAEGKIPDTPGDTPGFPKRGTTPAAEAPPQSATTEVVKKRGGRRVVAGIE